MKTRRIPTEDSPCSSWPLSSFRWIRNPRRVNRGNRGSPGRRGPVLQDGRDGIVVLRPISHQSHRTRLGSWRVIIGVAATVSVTFRKKWKQPKLVLADADSCFFHTHAAMFLISLDQISAALISSYMIEFRTVFIIFPYDLNFLAYLVNFEKSILSAISRKFLRTWKYSSNGILV